MGNPIYSTKAAKVYSFLLMVGPAPFDAVLVATGFKRGDCNKALNALRGAGYAVPERIDGNEWWIPQDSALIPDAFERSRGSHEALVWFIARLIEVGGSYSDSEGIARYPKGQELKVHVYNQTVQTGEIYVNLEDLKLRSLRECIKGINSGIPSST